MDERRVVYLEHARAVRRYLRAVERRREIEEGEDWRASSRYADFVEVASRIVAGSKRELAELREELKKSDDVLDRVYYYTIVEKQKADYIAKMTGYSRRQICRYQRQIKENIKWSVTR